MGTRPNGQSQDRRHVRLARRCRSGVIAITAIVLMPGIANASELAVSVVDVASPTGSVSLQAGSSAPIAIELTVTGKQLADVTVTVLRDWRLSDGVFTGSNPEAVTIRARESGGSTAYSTTGTVSVAAGHAAGATVYTLSVGAAIPTQTGSAKLEMGSHSNYAVTVTAPADTTPPVLTPTITGTKGLDAWYVSNVGVSWSVTDAQSTPTVLTGCATTTFAADTEGATSSCTAKSAGGQSSDSVTVKIDKTAPTGVVLSPSGELGALDWYTSNVTVETMGADDTSGPVSCTAAQSLSSETTGQVVNGSCTNAAGLTANATPLTVKIDRTGPSASLAVTSGDAGTNGWYKSNVTVSASGSDSVSGGVTCSAPVVLSSETTGAAVNGSCTNAAGLTTNAAPLTVKIDKTSPTASLAPSGALGADGWYTSDVSVVTNGADTISDPVTCTGPQTVYGDTAGLDVNGSCTNDAGLTQAAATVRVKVDETPPHVSLAVVSGTEGAGGWYTSDVVVTASGSDATSGIESCSADTSITDSTAGTVVTGWCKNGAGLKREVSLTMKVDKTPPTASSAVTTGIAGANGWYVSPVGVTTTGTFGPSGGGCTTDPASVTSDTAGTVVSGSCTNGAGVKVHADPLTVKIDAAAPTAVTLSGIADGSSYVFGGVPSAPTCAAEDATSGVSSCTVTGYNAGVGTHTLTATASDNAGNQSTATTTYTVLPWRHSGFYAPIDMDTTTSRVVNTVKNGSTVPLKFEVFAGTTELAAPSDVTALRTAKTSCSGASAEAPVEAVATGGTSLRYDALAGQFVYNWKTPSVASSCYDVIVVTRDGTATVAHFRLK